MHPEALRQHEGLLYRTNGRLFNHWEYSNGTENYKIKIKGKRVSNDTDIVRRWAVAGHGIVYRSHIDIAMDVNQGRLVPLLTAFKSPSVELYLLCPNKSQVTPSMIAFRELLRSKFAQMNSIEDVYSSPD